MADFEFYERDGKKYQRITSFTDFFSPPDFVKKQVETGKKEWNRLSRIALKFGTMVDERIRANPFSPAVKKSDKPEVKEAINAWHKWLCDYQPKQIIFPETLWDDERLIAGKPDYEWENQEGIWTLTDIKTSREIRVGNIFQLGGYAGMRKPKPNAVAILDLSKTIGNYEYLTNEKIGLTVDACIAGFHQVYLHYKIFNYLQSRLKPNRAWPEEGE